MKNKLTKVYLDKGKYPCVIVDNNYENTGMLYIKQLRFNKSYSGFLANLDELTYVGKFSPKQFKQLRQWCVNNVY